MCIRDSRKTTLRVPIPDDEGEHAMQFGQHRDAFTPVSYTHLDVYKRQREMAGHCNGLKICFFMRERARAAGASVPRGEVTSRACLFPTAMPAAMLGNDHRLWLCKTSQDRETAAKDRTNSNEKPNRPSAFHSR